MGAKMTPTKKNKKMQQITIKLKVADLDRLREYADKKGGNPVSHYIREAVVEYLETHYDK
jgi:metal-responsive CopG/Arc/MetJ family transcriptional regulator